MKNTGRIEFFDCLRGIAILLVVAAHYKPGTFPGGAIGVPIFFCMSGYFITTILLDEHRLDWATTWRFWVRRFFRVYPAYAVALILNYLIMRHADADFFSLYQQELAAIATFTYQGSEWIAMGPAVFWTLQIEFWFYLLMPLLVLAAGKGRLLTYTICALIIALLTYKLMRPESAPFFTWFSNLFVGSLIAIAMRHKQNWQIGNAYKTATEAAVILFLLLVVFASNNDRAIVWPIMAFIVCLVTALWIVSYLSSDHETNRPVIAWFGRISYSLYLVHAIPLDYVGGDYQLFKSRTVGFLVSLLIAIALHYTVERAFIRVGRAVTKPQVSQSLKAS